MSVTTRVSPPQAGQPPRRRNRRGAAVAAGVVLVVLVLAIWLVAFSSVLGVSTVRVTGLHSLTAAQIRGAAAIRNGEPLLRLDEGAIALRVESLPPVASATVHVSYPHTVTIQITERVAVGYLREPAAASTASSFVLIDHDGVQFRTVRSAPAGIPLFAVPAGAGQTATAKAVAGVAAALPASLLRRIASIQAFDPSAITLLLTDQRVVRWGSADQSAQKARILPILLNQPGTQFDVSDPSQVYAR